MVLQVGPISSLSSQDILYQHNMAAEEPPRPTNQVRVSSQRPLFFYVSLGKVRGAAAGGGGCACMQARVPRPPLTTTTTHTHPHPPTHAAPAQGVWGGPLLRLGLW